MICFIAIFAGVASSTFGAAWQRAKSARIVRFKILVDATALTVLELSIVLALRAGSVGSAL